MTYASPTSINSTQGFPALLTYLNTVTESWISNMLLIAVWIITFIGVYKAKDDVAGGFAIAGFLTFIVGLLFWLGGFITGLTLGIVVAFAIIGLIVIVIDNKQ